MYGVSANIPARTCSADVRDPVRSCPFWTGVFRQAFGGMEYVDSRRMFELSASLFRVRRIPQLLCPSISRGFRDNLQYFSQVVTKLYRTTQEVSGCRVLIDSSKTNKYCVGLSRIPDIDLHVVHIVRDSRAVAYSWQRKKKRPEIHWTTAFQRQSDVWAMPATGWAPKSRALLCADTSDSTLGFATRIWFPTRRGRFRASAKP